MFDWVSSLGSLVMDNHFKNFPKDEVIAIGIFTMLVEIIVEGDAHAL